MSYYARTLQSEGVGRFLTGLIREKTAGGACTRTCGSLKLVRITRPCDIAAWVAGPSLVFVARQARRAQSSGTGTGLDGGEIFVTDGTPGHCTILAADAATPAFAAVFELDRMMIARITQEAPVRGRPRSRTAVAQDDDALLAAALLRYADASEVEGVGAELAQLAGQEIHLRLLAGAHGDAVRSMVSTGSVTGRIEAAVSWLKLHFREPESMADLAARFNMGTSTFYRYFRAAVNMSPLQFRKELRLQDAHARMLERGIPVSQAGFEVGYESCSQFIRDYKRRFGRAPKQNVTRVRRACASGAAGACAVPAAAAGC